MKTYLNVGCGMHFSTSPEWTNLDFVSTGEGVIEHNLLNGIPFDNNKYDLVYHSHVLEHFSRTDGKNFIKECYRVLKPGGIIRIAIPDLEQIIRGYLKMLEEGLQDPGDEKVRANYEWMLLELYDQTVRNKSGGQMAQHLYMDQIPNEDFVFGRIGEEGRGIRRRHLDQLKDNAAPQREEKTSLKALIRKAVNIVRRKGNGNVYEEIGRFRLSGEIHQWMYDRYSLPHLLKQQGFSNTWIMDAFNSKIDNWSVFNLDGKDNVVRKPDSLFVEAIK